MKRLDAETQAKVLERHDMRMKEWEQHAAKVEALEASGQITREGNLIIDAKTGKSFTSDYDLWELRKPSGESVGWETVEQELRGGAIEAQHGAHLDWMEIPAGSADDFAQIILETRPGLDAKPVIEFHPDGRIRYRYFID